MKLTLRKVLFWPHLVAGVLAGVIVFILSLTGAALVFEKPVIRWADTEARTVTPGERRLPLDEVMERARAAGPKAAISGLTVEADPTSAVLVNFGREGALYVDPYSGETRPVGAQGWREFFHDVTDLHRYLLAHGDNRPLGKGITGAANLLFLLLALTGLYLWFPRKAKWRAWRPALWFRRGLKGKARDFSWHNVIGFWTLPVLLVLTVSGAVISYKWASDLVYRAAGEEPPAQGGPGAAPRAKVPTPADGATPGTMDAHFAAAAAAVPDYEAITWRNAPARPGAGGAQPPADGPKAINLSVRRKDAPPQSATVQVAIDPFTSAVLAQEGYETATAGRKARMWLRFLHTGEALGWFGQLLAGVASLGALFLVYTGLFLSWRRFFGKKRAITAMTEPVELPEPERSVA